MKYISHNLLLLLSILSITFYSCNKEDPEPDNTDGVKDEYNLQLEAHQYEVTQIPFYAGFLSKSTYAGQLGDLDIKLTAVGDSILAFYVGDVMPGNYDLVIPDLKKVKGEITIFETSLDKEPTVVINTLVEKMQLVAADLFVGSPESNNVKSAIINVNNVFKNSSEDKQFRMAAYYKANEQLFNDMLLADYDVSESGRVQFICPTELCKYKVAVLAFGAGIGVMWLAPDPVEKALGAGVAVIGYTKARQYYNEFVDEKIKVLDYVFNKISSGRVKAGVSFTIDQPYITSLSSVIRTVNASKQNDKNNGFLDFFGSNDFMRIDACRIYFRRANCC